MRREVGELKNLRCPSPRETAFYIKTGSCERINDFTWYTVPPPLRLRMKGTRIARKTGKLISFHGFCHRKKIIIYNKSPWIPDFFL
jgi:hypothetical protein